MLATALLLYVPSIIDCGGIQYGTNDPRRNVSPDGLAKHSGLFSSLLEVESRGGLFDHGHIFGAIRLVCNKPAQKPKAALMAGTDSMALNICVMLAHLRVKRDHTFQEAAQGKSVHLFPRSGAQG